MYAHESFPHITFSNVDNEPISNVVTNTRVRRHLTFEWEHRWYNIRLELLPPIRAVLFEAAGFEMSLQMNLILKLAAHFRLDNENNEGSTQENTVVQISVELLE